MALNLRQAVAGYLSDLQDTAVNAMLQQAEHCRRRGACRDLAAEVAMADVFISHATADSPFAEFLHRHLPQEGLSVYLASVSMPPGEC